MLKNKPIFKFIVNCLITIILISHVPMCIFAENQVAVVSAIDTVQVSYLNNDYSGKYLRNLSNSLVETSGTISSLGSSIKWQIQPLGNDAYAIRSMTDTTLYLVGSQYGLKPVELDTLDISPMPDRYKWTLTLSTEGGYLIQNVSTEKYLYSDNGSISSTSNLGTVGTDSYRQKVWRVADSTWYGNNSTYDRIELPYNYKFKTCYLFGGESKIPKLLDEYDNVLWGTAENFTFSGFNIGYVTLNEKTGTFTAVSTVTTLYSTTVTATHKVTGRTSTFSLVITPQSASVGVYNGASHDHSTALNTIRSNILGCGYSSANVYTGAFSTSQIDTYLDTDTNNIFVSRSHGAITQSVSGTQIGTAILLNNDANNSVFYRSIGSITNLDLSNMNLIMFVACKTGAGGEGGLNLPTVAVEQGASAAVGFEENISCSIANAWTEDIFALLEDGLSIKTACEQLKMSEEYASTGLAKYVVCGYKATKIT